MSSSDQNPYDPPKNPPESKSNWKTWSPFQSEIVREICANMTPEEKSKATRQGLLYGLWCAATIALPLQVTIMSWFVGRFSWMMAGVAAVLLVAHIAVVGPFRRYQRRFLADTAWARSKGIRPETLKLTRFDKL